MTLPIEAALFTFQLKEGVIATNKSSITGMEWLHKFRRLPTVAVLISLVGAYQRL